MIDEITLRRSVGLKMAAAKAPEQRPAPTLTKTLSIVLLESTQNYLGKRSVHTFVRIIPLE